MLKKAISAIISISMTLSVFAADIKADSPSVKVYADESFDDMALNETNFAPCILKASEGIDRRIVMKEAGNKALYAKAWGTSALFNADISIDEDYFVISAKIRLSGQKTSAELFKLRDSSNKVMSAIVIGQNGKATLCDGKVIENANFKNWTKVDIAIDLDRKEYDLYLNDKLQFENWAIPSAKSIGNIRSIQFELSPKEYGDHPEMYIDDFRVYQGQKLIDDSYFPKSKYNDEVLDFEPAKEVETLDEGTIKFNNFSAPIGYSANPKENTIEIRQDGDNSYLYFARDKNSNDAFIDITLSSKEKEELDKCLHYVVECDVYIEETEGSIELFSAKSDLGKWYVGTIDKGLSVSYGGMVSDNNWYRISLVYDRVEKTRLCYINGEFAAKSSVDNFKPALYRIGTVTGGGTIVYRLDNFRIYAGKALKPDEAEAEDESATPESGYSYFESAMETSEDALSLLNKGDFAMLLSNGVYVKDGFKNTASVKPYIKNGHTMMPVRLVSECLGKNVSWQSETSEVKIDDDVTLKIGSTIINANGKLLEAELAPEIIDGSAFLPLRDLCEKALGKKVYYDERGFVVVGDKEFILTNSDAVQNIQEPIDTLYRYLQFERPSGEDVINALKQKHPNKAHPRVLGTQDMFDKMKENIKSDELMATWARDILKTADSIVKSDVIKYELAPGSPPRLLYIAREIKERMLNLSVAFEITGDKKYFEAAWKNIEHVCNTYPNWNDYQHFLDTGEMAYAYAVCYDMFYNELSQEQRKLMRDTVTKHAFEKAIIAYMGMHSNGYWINGDDNWTSVCAGGLLSAAVAMADEEDTAEICEIIIGQTTQSFEYISSLFFPDGAWYESVNYLSYTLEFMCAGIGALYYATGSDYGLLSAPGVASTLDYSVAIHGPAKGAFNNHDGGDGYQLHPSHLWLASVLGKNSFYSDFVMLKKQLANIDSGDARMLLYYDPEKAKNAAASPLDTYYRQADIGSMRQNTSAQSLWAGVHAGKNGIDHDHLDLGEFIFDAGGIRWVNDNGPDNYNLPGYFSQNGYNIYLKRPEANNCLIINPREGYWGQSIKCETYLVQNESKPRGSIMTFDLSNAYSEDAAKVKRGFMLGDNRRSFTIRDEVELLDESTMYWFMNTPTDIKVDPDAMGATLSYLNQTLRLEVATNADTCIVESVPQIQLPTSPIVDGMVTYPNLNKIRIKLTASGNVGITVKLIPQIGYVDDIPLPDNTPISQWHIPDGEIPNVPKAQSITINGNKLADFEPDKYFYKSNLPLAQGIPFVEATTYDGAAEVVQATELSKEATITITSPSGEKSRYTISFKGEGFDGYMPVNIVSADADSLPEPQNGVKNAYDGDDSSRYVGNKIGGYLQYDLGEIIEFDACKIAFYQGGRRTTKFMVQVSVDGETFETIFDGSSDGDTDNSKLYPINGVGRYVRIVGFGNSDSSSYMSINEFVPMIKY